MTYLEALVLAIIEGITEFLPVSSTGHMVIASTFMGISENALTKNFEIVIQFGHFIGGSTLLAQILYLFQVLSEISLCIPAICCCRWFVAIT